MAMKKTVFMLLSAFILCSCEKENGLVIENTDIPLISKVLIDGVSYYEYTYNDANLLIEEKSKLNYTKHNYNDNNLLSSSEFYMDPGMFSSIFSVVEAAMNRKEWVNPDNTAKNLTQKFEYDGTGQLTRKIYARPSVTSSEYCEFTFDNDRISRQTMFWQDERTFYIDYSYDQKGNLIKESKYYLPHTGIPELWTTTEYEYDGMHNPYQAFKRLMSPGKFTNPNNIIKETYTIHFEVDQWIQKVQVISNTYEYNDKGYPVKVNGNAEYVYK
jgi:hypothetical protein